VLELVLEEAVDSLLVSDLVSDDLDDLSSDEGLLSVLSLSLSAGVLGRP